MTPINQKFHPNEPGKAAGMIYCALSPLVMIEGILCIVFTTGEFALEQTVSKSIRASMRVLTAGGVGFIIMGIALLALGLSLLKLVWDYRKIVRYLGAEEMVSVSEMALALHWPESVLRRRIVRMIRKNLFLQGHLHAAYFILTNALYGQYLDAVFLWNEQQKEWNKLGFDREEQLLLKSVQPLRENIHRSAQLEKDPQMRACMEKLDRSIEKLLAAAEQSPESLSRLDTFMHYFLPTADELIRQYQELPQELDTQNIGQMRSQIFAALQTLVRGFEQLAEQLGEKIEFEITSNLYAVGIVMEQHRRMGVTE